MERVEFWNLEVQESVFTPYLFLITFRILNLLRNSSNISNKCRERFKALRDAIIFSRLGSYSCFDISEDHAGSEKAFSIDFYNMTFEHPF